MRVLISTQVLNVSAAKKPLISPQENKTVIKTGETVKLIGEVIIQIGKWM